MAGYAGGKKTVRSLSRRRGASASPHSGSSSDETVAELRVPGWSGVYVGVVMTARGVQLPESKASILHQYFGVDVTIVRGAFETQTFW